jgi:SNF2 family DNA or RNA helicase
VICPLNTTLNWEQEFEKWLTKKERPKVYQLASLKGDNKERCSLLTDWHRDGGVAIIGYQLFRILTSYRGRSNKIKATVLTCLLDPGTPSFSTVVVYD